MDDCIRLQYMVSAACGCILTISLQASYAIAIYLPGNDGASSLKCDRGTSSLYTDRRVFKGLGLVEYLVFSL